MLLQLFTLDVHDMREHIFHAAVLDDELARRLWPHARHAGDVVRRVAHEPLEVNELQRLELVFLLKGRPFPEGKYNNAVAFLTELKTGCLLGSHDADMIEGDLIIYIETEKTPFPGIHGDAHSYPGDFTCRDDGSVVVSMIAGADERTCLTDNSKHVLYFAFGTPGMAAETLERHLDQVYEYIKVLAPAAKTQLHMY